MSLLLAARMSGVAPRVFVVPARFAGWKNSCAFGLAPLSEQHPDDLRAGGLVDRIDGRRGRQSRRVRELSARNSGVSPKISH
jgi:hypothetical protein